MASETTVQLDRGRVRSMIEREAQQLDERTQGRARDVRARARARSAAAWRPPTRRATRGRSTWSPVRAPSSTTSTATACGTSTTASARWSRGTPTRRSCRAVRERVALGTHFAATTEDGVLVAEELQRRWGLERWRFVNSGSEATMDAIRIARGYTGRDTIVKIFGSYHGHHDAVMVSIGVEYDKIGDRENYASLPYGAGIPKAVSDLTIPVPFNDAGAMERRIERLDSEGRKPACVIMEAAMMNLGVVLPEDGYLAGGPRAHRAPRHRADLRRGQDRARDRGRRRDRALRREARHGDAREDARRRAPVGRDRRHRGDHARGRGRDRLPGRHLQRQPARDGGGAREPRRGADARGLPAPGRAQRPHRLRLPGGDRAPRAARATRSASAPRAASRSPRRRSSTTRRSRPTRTSRSPNSRGSTT